MPKFERHLRLLTGLVIAAAVLVPALATAGFVSAGINVMPPPPQPISREDLALLLSTRDAIYWTFGLLLGGTLLWRAARRLRRGTYRIHHSSGQVLAAHAGSSLLEAVRDAGIAHASVCGGRARCTTCRVRIAGGLEALEPPEVLEAEALRRINAAPNVRLACQFAGDGLLALYGLETEIGPACREALAGAADMHRRMGLLNARLAHELAEPLRIGIGVHAGVAIVGSMGPPAAPIVSAIGDTINSAARLESLTKQYGCTLIVSLDTLRFAGIVPPATGVERVEVRGRTGQLEVLPIEDPVSLLPVDP